MLAIASILNKGRTVLAGLVLSSQRGRFHHRVRCSLLAVMGVVVGALSSSCRDQAIAQPRSIALEQSWELDLGDAIEGFRVVASLGDISIQLRGARIRAPFDGEIQLAAAGQDCIFFSSPEVPAYLFRYCGVRRPSLGGVEEGQQIGSANFLHFATMRRQPEGTWAIVEPSTNVLERSLERY